MEESRPRWSARTKTIVSLLLLALAVFLLYRFRLVLTPLILAAVLAYVLSPLVKLLEARLGIYRAPAVLLAYLILIAVLAALSILLARPLAAETAGINLDIQQDIQQVQSLLSEEIHIAGMVIDARAVFGQLTLILQNALEPVFSQTIGFLIEAISSLVWLVFIVVISFYLIKDGHALRAWVESLTPPGYRRDFNLLLEETNLIWASFFRGQIMLALVVAVIFSVAGFALGLPYALAMAILAGILEFLPSLGHGIWLVVAGLLALFAGSTWLPVPHWAFALIILGLHLVYQQFDLNYLIPRIIGRSVHLPPLVVIMGIVTGALMAGVIGILLAAPTIATARVYGRYVYANLFDMEPFPSSVAPPLPPPNPRWWKKTSPVGAQDVSGEP